LSLKDAIKVLYMPDNLLEFSEDLQRMHNIQKIITKAPSNKKGYICDEKYCLKL